MPEEPRPYIVTMKVTVAVGVEDSTPGAERIAAINRALALVPANDLLVTEVEVSAVELPEALAAE